MIRLGVLASHPIQYQAPLFRELAQRLDLEVFFAHRQSASEQAAAGYGVAFDWDLDLLDGYRHAFLVNRARRPGVGRFSGCDTPEIDEHIRGGGFDAFLVTGWHLKCYWQAVAACRRAGVPVMVRGDSQLLTPRSSIKRWLKALVYPWLLRRLDAALYVGQRNRDYLVHYGVPGNRLFFVPHCVDTAFFANAAVPEDRSATRASWGISCAGAAILFAGRLVDFKRPADLLEALAVLRGQGCDVAAVFAGEGEKRTGLETLGQRLGVPAVFLGFQNQTALPAVYAGADALVLPSDGAETWGLVVNEALACGTPCVVSDACGCAPDMIVPGVTGTVYPYGDISALAKAIQSSLCIPRNTPAIRARSDAYSVSAAAAGILDACSWLIERRGHATA